MGEPDSYREALSALRYIDEGIYSSYWDHPLTMYVFVGATHLARALGVGQIAVLNTLAVVFGSLSIWPFYHLVRKLVNKQTAAFASAALIILPSFIRFSGYLSHEVVGFAFALWSLYLFETALERQSKTTALAFGLFYGATWSARPIGAMLIGPPLLLLLFHLADRAKWSTFGKLFAFALSGFLACLFAVYRPELIQHLASFSNDFLSRFYEFGRYTRSTTQIAWQSVTPALVVMAAAGCGVLVWRRKFFIALFAGAWILTAYVFYTGMYSMHRYFLVLLPPSLLLLFTGADQIDSLFFREKGRFGHFTKVAVTLLLIVGALGPILPDLLYYRKMDDDKIAAKEIGAIVGRNLLLTTALEPQILYYNREQPPETVYLVTESSPGTLSMRLDALRSAQRRIRNGQAVYATGEVIPHLRFVGVEANCSLVWQYKYVRLYRITNLRFLDRSGSGYGTG